MKKISLILFFIATVFVSINAQKMSVANKVFCDFGITFEISNNPSWGYGEPIVLTVQPFSPADRAGLKIGDIIMEVNGKATYLRNYQTITSWLADDSSELIKLTVRNIGTYFKEFSIYRECKTGNSLTEFNLASAYSFYSLRDTNERSFSLPLRVDPNQNIDFSDYRTFDFIDESGNGSPLDKYVNDQLEKGLIALGLTKNSSDPDMLVQAYYSFQSNVKYDSSTRSGSTKSWRYDTKNQEMIALPILSAEDPNAEAKGSFIIELGFRFFDKKFVDKTRLTQIWDAKTRDFLTEKMTIEEYSNLHTPLILMQYPYSSSKTIAKYLVSFKGFNYTGLNFSADDLKTITYIDPKSPASASGIQVGNMIEKINGVKFIYNSDELENGYRRFLTETMQFRDKKTRFRDANGFPDCMYWSSAMYSEIIETFKKQNIYTPCFSYLYSFEKYIPGGSPSGDILVDVRMRDGQVKQVSIKPQLQRSIVLRAL